MEKWTVEHQGFPSGHPWRVEHNGELLARCRTYQKGQDFVREYQNRENHQWLKWLKEKLETR